MGQKSSNIRVFLGSWAMYLSPDAVFSGVRYLREASPGKAGLFLVYGPGNFSHVFPPSDRGMLGTMIASPGRGYACCRVFNWCDVIFGLVLFLN